MAVLIWVMFRVQPSSIPGYQVPGSSCSAVFQCNSLCVARNSTLRSTYVPGQVRPASDLWRGLCLTRRYNDVGLLSEKCDAEFDITRFSHHPYVYIYVVDLRSAMRSLALGCTSVYRGKQATNEKFKTVGMQMAWPCLVICAAMTNQPPVQAHRENLHY